MDFAELLKTIEEIKPLSKELCAEVEPMVKDVVESVFRILEGAANKRVALHERTVNEYLLYGFTREEAILLLLNSRLAMAEYMERLRKGK